MARQASVAIGGYYKTPTHLLPLMARLLKLSATKTDFYRNNYSVLDPCAGEGEAIAYFAKHLTTREVRNSFTVYTVELEAQRHEKLKETLSEITYSWGYNQYCLHGDALCTTWKRPTMGVSFLYLNPPYDYDIPSKEKSFKRFEERFLNRYIDTLADNGILFFVVPYYVLKASADTIARHLTDVVCYRFPNNDFDVFKQVLLVGKKTTELVAPNKQILAQVESWASSVDNMPFLDEYITEVFEIPAGHGLTDWAIKSFDLQTMQSKYKPWHQTSRKGGVTPLQGFIPEGQVLSVLQKNYPVAMPPRPVHIASGLASGIFNGARVESTSSKFPPILVKGVFNREFRTVDYKTNKEGDVVGEIQVQKPSLVVTVLDLTKGSYHTLQQGPHETGAEHLEGFGIADLLKHYGPQLLTVLEKQCPILYDPRKDSEAILLREGVRKLYTAQTHAAKSLVRTLGGIKCKNRKRKSAIFLGEIGTGKTTVALTVCNTLNVKRPLVFCPPQLLDMWRQETNAVLPGVPVVYLKTIEDVEKVSHMKDPVVVSVMSRETAKLSHAWESISKACPRCGSVLPEGDLAKKRAVCTTQKFVPKNSAATLLIKVARFLRSYNPSHAAVLNVLTSRHDANLLRIAVKNREKFTFTKAPRALLEEIICEGLNYLSAQGTRDSGWTQIILRALFALQDNEWTERAALFCLHEPNYWMDLHLLGSDIFMLLPQDGPEQARVLEGVPRSYSYGYHNTKHELLRKITSFKQDQTISFSEGKLRSVDGKLLWDDLEPHALDHINILATKLIKESIFLKKSPCNERLYQAKTFSEGTTIWGGKDPLVVSDHVKKIALSKYITKHHKKLFDFFILDEAHEAASEDSAQSRAAHRIISTGIPTIAMSGSIMNGYAESLFANFWALSPFFRQEFSKNDKQRFVDRYGYRKRILEEKETKSDVAYGSNSDRVEKRERVTGNAEGVLPLFILRHLLPISTTLHKADLALDLPPCKHLTVKIAPSPEQALQLSILTTALTSQIKKDMFDPERAGKLWGALAELPGYLDCASSTVGNTPEGRYQIRYPHSVGGGLVADADPIDASILLPKEEWLIEKTKEELAEGRNVLVFGWHVALLPRLATILEKALGVKVPVLYANKVTPSDRQVWIDEQIVKKGRRVLVANPLAIQTGLNNLVHFATQVWLENPACNPNCFRQAIGRVDRIGQQLDTRIYFATYTNSLQEQCHQLLLRKVAVATSVDGLDPESALQAAGIGEDHFSAGMDLGRQLWALLTKEMPMV